MNRETKETLSIQGNKFINEMNEEMKPHSSDGVMRNASTVPVQLKEFFFFINQKKVDIENCFLTEPDKQKYLQILNFFKSSLVAESNDHYRYYFKITQSAWMYCDSLIEYIQNLPATEDDEITEENVKKFWNIFMKLDNQEWRCLIYYHLIWSGDLTETIDNFYNLILEKFRNEKIDITKIDELMNYYKNKRLNTKF